MVPTNYIPPVRPSPFLNCPARYPSSRAVLSRSQSPQPYLSFSRRKHLVSHSLLLTLPLLTSRFLSGGGPAVSALPPFNSLSALAQRSLPWPPNTTSRRSRS